MLEVLDKTGATLYHAQLGLPVNGHPKVKLSVVFYYILHWDLEYFIPS